MRIGFSVIFLSVITLSTFARDDSTALYTDARPPAKEALDRLNLRLAWRAFVPVDTKRDGIQSIQVSLKHLFVQTKSGIVAVYNAATGQSLWQVRIGKPFETVQPLTFNSRMVFVVSGTQLYGLDRFTGALLWDYRLPLGISAPPIADDDQIYLCNSTGHIYAYVLPHTLYREAMRDERRKAKLEAEKKAETDADKKGDTALKTTDKDGYSAISPLTTTVDVSNPKPVLAWEYESRLPLNMLPLQNDVGVLFPASVGTVIGLKKYPANNFSSNELFRYSTNTALSAPASRFDDTVFLGGSNGEVYAMSLNPTGQTRWRFSLGSSVQRMPLSIDIPVSNERYDKDVYAIGSRDGLYRIDRESGESRWQDRGNVKSVADVSYFLSANRKFVYALDRVGRLLVIDRGRGGVLSRYDFRDFVVPVANDWTDRIYLAANNGLIICMHDKEYTLPPNYRINEEKPFDVSRLPPIDETFRLQQAKILNTKITDFESDPMPLIDALIELERRYNLQVAIASDRTFREYKDPAGVRFEPVGNKMVFFPEVEDVLLSDVLKKMLDQVNCHYFFHDRIYVLPGKVVQPGDAPAPPPADKE